MSKQEAIIYLKPPPGIMLSSGEYNGLYTALQLLHVFVIALIEMCGCEWFLIASRGVS